MIAPANLPAGHQAAGYLALELVDRVKAGDRPVRIELRFDADGTGALDLELGDRP